MAGNYGWTNDMNLKAEANPDGFRARLGVRFKINDIEVKAVIKSVDKPADAYMVLRMGEMSGHPTDYVLKQYQANRGKGWGTVAKSLGIKPGSSEFHALKQGHDLYDEGGNSNNKGKGKTKNKSPRRY
jgi:hypothetical protein